MSSNQYIKELKLRPHHAFCLRFLPLDTFTIPVQGAAAIANFDKVTRTLKSSPDTLITLVKGIDDICCLCPLNLDDRCQNPQGNENETRKWDAIILKELCLSYDANITVDQLHALTTEKSPLIFCKTRCPHRMVCKMLDTENRPSEDHTCN